MSYPDDTRTLKAVARTLHRLDRCGYSDTMRVLASEEPGDKPEEQPAPEAQGSLAALQGFLRDNLERLPFIAAEEAREEGWYLWRPHPDETIGSYRFEQLVEIRGKLKIYVVDDETERACYRWPTGGVCGPVIPL